jgi:hypothetical protein
MQVGCLPRAARARTALAVLEGKRAGVIGEIVPGGNAMVVAELVSLIHLGKVSALPHPTV